MKGLSRRSQEAHRLRGQLSDLGLTEEYPGMSEVYDAFRDYTIKCKESELTVQLHGLQRLLVLRLTLDPDIFSTVFLQHQE